MSDKDWKKRFAAETAKHVAMHRKAFAEGGKVPTLHDTMENVAGGIGMGGALEGDSDYHTAVNDPSGRVLGTQSPVDYIAPEALLGAPSAARAAARVAPELLGNEIGSVGSAVKPSAQAKPNFLELEHYSPTGDIKSIDPKHAGTGYDQSVKGRDIGVNVSFHYEKGATPEDLVSGNGYRYSSKIDLNKTPIYDLSSDPEGIAQRSIDRNGRMDMQDITQQVRGAGYGGYKVPGHPDEKLAKSVMLFDPVEPHSVKPIGDIKKIEAGRQAIRTQAERYNQGENLPKPAPHFNEALDPERGAAIANEYEKMEHNPNDPEVQKSYQALNQETRAQFKDIQKRRPDLKIEAIPPGAPNPYNSSDAMTHDLHVNNHLWYFPTDQGFGSEAGAAADHPLMQPTDLKDSNGRPMLANDAFRVVHDYFGHGKELNAFGPKGEEAAWRAHAQMYSPEARRAMTTETRGQNSWVNFGPKGAANRANPGMTTYADQKAGLLPDWASTPNGKPPAQTQREMAVETSKKSAKMHNPGIPAGRRPRRDSKYAHGGEVQMYADGSEGLVESAPPAPQMAPSPTAQAPQEVHVVDSMGDTYPIPAEHLQEALSQGYRQASPEESHDYTTQAQYGTPGQQAISGIEGLASGVLTSTGTAAIERGLGVNPEGIRGRAEANPWTRGLGELGGFAAGAATGFGEAAMLAKAGQAIMPAIKGAGIVSKIGTDALVGGFEGLLMGSDMVGAKAIQQDPDLSAGHAALSIGLTGVMGAALGGVGGAIVRRLGLGKELNKAGEEGAGPGGPSGGGETPYPEPQMFVSTLDAPKLEAGDLATGIKYSEAKPSFKQDFEEAITKGERKPTANLTEAIAEKYNLPVLEGHISANKFVQMGEDALRNSPTVAGQARANKWEGAYKAAEDVLNKAIGDGAGMSKAEVGQMMNDSLRAAIKEENAPIKAMYDQLKLHTEHIPLSLDTGRIITEIEAMPEARLLGNLPGGSIIKGAIDGIAKAQTVDDLKIIGSALNPGFSASPAEKRVAAILRDKLRMLEEDSIEAFAKHTAKTPEEKAAALALRGQREQANAAYKPFMEDLRKLAKALGKRNIGGAADALQFISELTPEQLTSRLFNKNNSQFLKFFEAKFPQQAALMREYQKGVMREQGLIQGVFSPKKFFTAVAKLEPEIQSAIYSKAELRTIAEMQHYLGEFPKNFNPSGTAHMANFRGHFNDMAGPAGIGFGLAGPVGGAIGAAVGHFRPGMQDAMIEAYIKKFGATPKGAQAAALAKATLDGEKSAVKAVKAVFDKAKEMPATATVTEGAREKLSEMVDEFSANPDKMIDANAHTPIPAYAQSFSATTARAVQYLAGMRPDTGVKAPLDVKLPPNAFAKADYNNALSIAQQPLHILSRIKSGTMTTQDVQTLKTIYPAVYQSLSEKLMSQVIEASHKGVSVPYQLRLQLSTFLGQPLDSTMTPQAIHSIQAQSAAKEQERKASPAPSASSTKGLKKMGDAAQSPEQSKAAGRAKRNN